MELSAAHSSVLVSYYLSAELLQLETEKMAIDVSELLCDWETNSHEAVKLFKRMCVV